MLITNKIDSIKLIKKLNLNRFPEELFKANEEDKVQNFLIKYPAKYYAIRDKSKANGTFKLAIAYDKVLKETKGYKLFTINISSINYAEYQLLVGEIEILANGEVFLTVSTDKSASVRDALKKPTFNLKTNILDKTLNNIPYFDLIFQYIIDNSLQDVIVEFALFNKEVGIKKEKIIVYELRTHY